VGTITFSSNGGGTQTRNASLVVSAPTLSSLLPTFEISPIAPLDNLTLPALEGLIDAALVPLEQLLPPTVAQSFSQDLVNEVNGLLGNQTLVPKLGLAAIISIGLSDFVGSYIDQAAEIKYQDTLTQYGPVLGPVLAPVVAGSYKYAMQVIANTAINVISLIVPDPPLALRVAANPAVLREIMTACFAAGIIQASTDDVTKLIMEAIRREYLASGR